MIENWNEQCVSNWNLCARQKALGLSWSNAFSSWKERFKGWFRASASFMSAQRYWNICAFWFEYVTWWHSDFIIDCLWFRMRGVRITVSKWRWSVCWSRLELPWDKSLHLTLPNLFHICFELCRRTRARNGSWQRRWRSISLYDRLFWDWVWDVRSENRYYRGVWTIFEVSRFPCCSLKVQKLPGSLLPACIINCTVSCLKCCHKLLKESCSGFVLRSFAVRLSHATSSPCSATSADDTRRLCGANWRSSVGVR